MAERASEQSIFLHAVGLPSPADRAAYVDEVCRDNPGLRAQLEALLAAHDRLGGGTPPTGPEAAEPATSEALAALPRNSEAVGTIIAGRYKLLEAIGEGGMGTVWLAQQTEPVKRPVAVKLIKAGMDSRQVLTRFEAERQALALMDHPNIAKVLDAGATPDGRPFFVMELVKGVPITKYCDQHRLTPRQRLELFVPVCQAIQHAHHKGIIHRDIKPSNVLVALYDDRPVPKVIDFGVAKATGQQLTEQTLHTGFGAVVGTIEYMSPEQASFNQLDVDTRSDIYSLGVLLYELLAGSPPFGRKELEKAGMLEMLRLIREQEPSKPSTKLSTAEGLPTLAANRGTEPKRLTALVRGELDWIVMKALEKDRSRRYETANGLAADMQRYLADEPVQACPPSTGYRLRKFARRNKAALTTVSVVVLAVLLLVGSIGWMVRDRTAREQEIARDQVARQAATEQGVNLAIKEAMSLLHQGRHAEGLSAAKRAEGILAGGGSEELRARARELQNDLRMALRLDEIRLPGKDIPGAVENRDAQYAQAFREYGIDVESLEPQQAAEQVAAQTIRTELIVALDNWANERKFTSKGADTSWKRLIAVARAADPDQLRNQVRDAVEQGKKEVLRDLAGSARISTLPMQTLDLLGAALPDGVAFLRAVQRQYPGDFWINFKLGWVLEYGPPSGMDEAIRFYTAVLALRPDNGRVQGCLGRVLALKGRWEEAFEFFRAAASSAPDDAPINNDFAWTLTVCPDAKLRDPIKALRRAMTAVRLAPHAWSYWNTLGAAQYRAGNFAEALAALYKSMELNGGHRCENWLFLAMAHAQLQNIGEARKWYHMGIRWIQENKSDQGELKLIREEAAQILMGVEAAEILAEAQHGIRRLARHAGGVGQAVISCDGQRVLSGGWDQIVRLSDIETGKELHRFDVRDGKQHHTIRAVALSPDGRRALAASLAGTVWLWDMENGKEPGRCQHSGVTSVAISPDGRRALLGSFDGPVVLWDLEKWAETRRFQEVQGLWSVDFSPDGGTAVVAGGRGDSDNLAILSLWDLETGKELRRFDEKLSKGIWRAVFSPDGNHVLSAGIDRIVRLWEVETGKQVRQFTGHTGEVRGVAFSPDGRHALSGGNDHAVRLWDVETGKELLHISGRAGNVHSVAFSPDGRQALYVAEDGWLRLWTLPAEVKK